LSDTKLTKNIISILEILFSGVVVEEEEESIEGRVR
jgi:hypothetical protein